MATPEYVPPRILYLLPLLRVGRILFSSYRVVVHTDLCLPHHVPGIGRPGKVLAAKITEKLVFLMVGFHGEEQPLLSLAYWRPEVQVVRTFLNSISTSGIVVFELGNIHPLGTLAHITSAPDHSNCSLRVRVAFQDNTAFWAFAYLMGKPLAHATDIATDVRANGHLISQMVDYFKADNGAEYLPGEAPPATTAFLPRLKLAKSSRTL
ncbi:hypothetical protein B0H11DRAFT_1933986 [Mycena galericulata]|nr:hypothetical protein B0H11DRAFT_1933986 [Mycena galericulata]